MDRESKLAENLVNYSCSVKRGEKVLIEVRDVNESFVVKLVKAVQLAGGLPFVDIQYGRVNRELMKTYTADYGKLQTKYELTRMSDIDAYISVRGMNNLYEMSDVPSENIKNKSLYYALPIHHRIRCKKKWVLLNYPGGAYAQNAGMSSEAFEDFFFNVCNLDYSKMDKAMDALVTLMDKTDKVRIVAKGTDLTFSIKGIKAIKCSGSYNIPDGEVYTAPVKDSVNGVIEYNIPTVQSNSRFDNIRLVVANGKIIEATCQGDNKKLNEILNTDDGSRYFGEFALGVNPYVVKPMLDILFDEKMCGSIHLTPGACYEEASNGNESAVHWDMVQSHLPQYGGGEIYFDDVLIRKDGLFVIKELSGLNPDNLK